MDKSSFFLERGTGFIKATALLTMLIDHVGYIFFPFQPIWRIIGRISFPLFAFCLVCGFFHTKNLKKYFLRLLAFALVSQIPYSFCFYPEEIGFYNEFGGVLILSEVNNPFLESFHLNIGFTLLLGLLAIFGLEHKKYIVAASAVLLSLLPFAEYGFYGVGLMMLFYFLIREKKAVFAVFAAGYFILPLFGILLGDGYQLQSLAILSLPFILFDPKIKVRIPRWLNYGFYPIHLCVIAAIKYFII